MTLGEKQRKFFYLFGKLIEWLYANGYEATFGEAYRSDEQAEINALGNFRRQELCAYLRAKNEFEQLAFCIGNNTGSGIRITLHGRRLAVDINLFKDGVYLTDSASYAEAGAFWKTLDPSCCWGGDFPKPDAYHFSFTHEGIR